MDKTKDTMPLVDAAGDPPGIVVLDRAEPPQPLIAAFIWGVRSQPQRTLPFGRWKETA